MFRGDYVTAVLTAGAALLGPAMASSSSIPATTALGHVLDNRRVHVEFASKPSLTQADSDRVDVISWHTPAGYSTGNVAVSGGLAAYSPDCGYDASEFFGQAYGEKSVNPASPVMVGPGAISVWQNRFGTMLSGNTSIRKTRVCNGSSHLAGLTHTTYALSTAASRINQLSITRVFTFRQTNMDGNLRAYIPRLAVANYDAVIWPNAAGVIQSALSKNCGSICEIDDWKGTWFADVNTKGGGGLMVIRNNAARLPAVLALDSDDYSRSNNTSVALQQPAGGWLGQYTERENLCFFNATTWTTADRAAGRLPSGCTVPS